MRGHHRRHARRHQHTTPRWRIRPAPGLGHFRSATARHGWRHAPLLPDLIEAGSSILATRALHASHPPHPRHARYGALCRLGRQCCASLVLRTRRLGANQRDRCVGTQIHLRARGKVPPERRPLHAQGQHNRENAAQEIEHEVPGSEGCLRCIKLTASLCRRKSAILSRVCRGIPASAHWRVR